MSRNLVTVNCLFVLALQISLFRRSINDRKKLLLLELHLIGLYFHSFSTLKKYANPAQIKDIENTTFFDLGGNSFVLTSCSSILRLNSETSNPPSKLYIFQRYFQ